MYFIFHICKPKKVILTFIKAGIIITCHMFFDMSAGEKKLTIRSIFIWERLFFDSKINKKDTCLVDKFKFTFDKSEDLQQKAYQFYKEKKSKWRKRK
jgi:hypothetical protein